MYPSNHILKWHIRVQGSHKNWSALTKEAYVIYMSFAKMVFYLKDAHVKIKFDHAPLAHIHIFSDKEWESQ